jgi:LacI family transcriptional regulator
LNIYEIAKLSGLSTATVSRVINKSDKVSPEAIRKVQAVIDQYGYTPSLVARELSMQKTNAIGIVLPGINSYFSALIEAINRVLRQNGYHLLVTSNSDGVYNEQEEIENIGFLVRKRVDGIIFYVSKLTSLHLTAIERIRDQVKTVLINGEFQDLQMPVILQDSVNGAKKIYRHLIECGARRIAYIGGPLYEGTAILRYQAFVSTLSEQKLVSHPSLIKEGSFGFDSGYEAARELLASGEPFDAIACANDKMAVGALRALNEAGLRVPEDVLLTGYDDEEITSYTQPGITTVRQDQYRLGEESARLLLRGIRHETGEQRIVMEQELIIRGSTAVQFPKKN